MIQADRIRLLLHTAMAAERALDRVEDRMNIDLGRRDTEAKDEEYYPQFERQLREEASHMSRYYEVFYCLEKSVRKLVAETLEAAHGASWWANVVPQSIRDNAASNMQREIDSGVTQRSDDHIDYTTFGELGEIVRQNWASFDALFSSQKAFTKVMTSLNMLRGPIAHCTPLAADEAVRLELTLRDWFRLME